MFRRAPLLCLSNSSAILQKIMFSIINLKFFCFAYLSIETLVEPHCDKTGFLRIKNKDADQLRGINRLADQRLCFRYINSTIPLLSK